MKGKSPMITAAAALYQLLLYLYPRSFRQEFGREMILTFRDASQFEQAQGGTSAMLGLWIAFAFDLITTAFAERAQEVFTMSSYSFGRIAGAGAAIAGIYWIALLLADVTGMNRMNTRGVWVLLLALGAALVILVASALYIQGSHNFTGTAGLAVLAIGSMFLALSATFYALNVDLDDSRAFMFQFLGHTVSGLGIIMIGLSFRARDYFKGLSTVLVALGFFVMLFWPVTFFTTGLIFGGDDSALGGYGDFIYSADVVAQALTWILLGLMAYRGLSEPEEQRLPLHQDQR